MTKINRLMTKLPEKSCGLITSDINRRYFTGMKSSAGVLAVFNDEAYLIIDFRYIEKARDTVTDCNVIEMTDTYSQLEELIKKHDCRQLFIEDETMTVASLKRLTEKLNGCVKISPDDTLSRLIRDMRQIKTDEEIALMIKAQRIAEAALTETLNFIKEGVTEREIALFLDSHMLSMGAEALSFETIALCGENTSLPHGVPSDRRLKKGEPILMDFGAVYEGYHSDMTRTVVLGEPTEEFERVYQIVLDAQRLTINAARAGITGIELDSVARNYIAEQGYGDHFGHGLGHSVGMEIHEFPYANKSCDIVLKENVIMTIEPGIYLPKKFGIRIEDFVIIRKNGCENMTAAPKNLIKL